MSCLACDLAGGAVPLPGGRVHTGAAWLVEHCVGPLGLGTLVVKPARHVTHLAELDAAERAELGPLLSRTAATVQDLTSAEQVYACLWSHAGRERGHLHFVVQPATAASIEAHDGRYGPQLQAAQFADGQVPDPDMVAAFAPRASQELAPPAVPGGLLSVPHGDGLSALVEALDRFVADVAGRDEQGLLAPSRCAGWTVLDVAVHVHIGLQDMLLGVVSPTSDPPDVDAATYWRSFPPGPSDDVFAHTRFVRSVASAYRRPGSVVAHLRTTAAALRRAVTAAPEGSVAFQGHVLATGDFLATWAVELAVHHLDVHGEPPQDALALSRATVEALAGSRAPEDADDATLVLAGTGRLPPAAVTGWDVQLPVFG